MTDSEILEGVLEEFKKLAAIPRPSGHIEKVSLFLKDYFAEMGFNAVQDEVKNVIVDAPPAAGFENAPLIVLQGHMDMVAVAADGVPFNPTKDPIHLMRDDKYLKAAGTSLGADDGMGVAAIMFLAKNMKTRGALRFIFTVDEETGMTGASFLDEKYLKDAKYLINCDSEVFDEITVGCAGNVTMDFEKEINRIPIAKKNIVEISLTGLLGGHSGERIGDNRANAIKSLAKACGEIDGQSEIELIEINGGNARNAIPSFAKCVIATDMEPDMLNIVLMNEGRSLYSMYDEEGATFSVKEVATDKKAIARGDAMRILQFINLVHSGIYAVDQNGNVETSANLGMIRTEENQVKISVLPRSSRDKKLDLFISKGKDLAELTGFKAAFSDKTPCWSYSESVPLAEAMKEIFEKTTGRKMRIKETHAGLECGYFKKKNPNLEIVSVGTTNEEIHSPRERLVLATVAPMVRMIEETILDISKKTCC
ncbi:MAG: beta-Ala-His dipeptidase [Selenomonadaceae bacterium]|nr:beta-Ala-His dipeptidase [Selenomonadaceae bacterium]